MPSCWTLSAFGERSLSSPSCTPAIRIDTYGQISAERLPQGVGGKPSLQCCTTSCRFYEELDAILGCDPTSTAKAPVDTSVAHMPVESGPSQEEEILDEDVEVDPEAKNDLEVRDACNQELFSTPEEAS
ncbi:hypothetical protein UY3_13651 [Chelonia mydas]|uniref:Uncharacterized protein n=1 Tax=Chelonia mydas TaxID=8469 RepID=M7BM14_CHEMY|nr:hypothetical protein UY3_13651 [Chelonia mydas]